MTSVIQVNEGYQSSVNLERQAAAYVFFAYATAFVAAGLLAGVLARGNLNPAGEDGWFSFLGPGAGFNRAALPLMGALTMWIVAFAISIWHFNSVDLFDQLGVAEDPDYHGYLGYWSAFFTGVVALIVAGMVAERWYTRAMLVGSMWTLYQVSAWFEAGIWYNENLDGTWGALIWLAITFFLCVGVYSVGNHERYGGWANRGETDRKLDYQVWCGPAIGSFNDFIRGTYLDVNVSGKFHEVFEGNFQVLRGACVLKRQEQIKVDKAMSAAVDAAALAAIRSWRYQPFDDGAGVRSVDGVRSRFDFQLGEAYPGL